MSEKRSVVGIYEDNGLRAVFTSSFNFLHNRFVKPMLLSRRIAVNTDRITELADSRVRIPDAQQKIIQYRGSSPDSVPQPIKRTLGTVSVCDQFCWEFADAELFGPAVFLRVDGTYVIPSAVGWDDKDDDWRRDLAVHIPYTRGPSVSNTRSIESAFVLTDLFRFESNFGMWYYETLPKLAIYEAYCDSTGKRPKLVVPELTNQQAQTLDLLGFADRDKLGDERLRADEVIVPTQTGWSRTSQFDTPPSNVRWVRDSLVSAISPSDQFADRVYVSRVDADFRYVDNEAAVMDVLRPLGFEKYALADMTLHDQMRLFANADIVVGPHGAGMAHMVHATDTTFVELFPGETGVMPYYFVLANDLQHRYEFVVCSAGANEHPDSDHPRHANLIVDIDELERVISRQLADRS